MGMVGSSTVYMDDDFNEIRNSSGTVSTPSPDSPDSQEPPIKKIPRTKTFKERMSLLPEILGVSTAESPKSQKSQQSLLPSLVGLPLTPDPPRTSREDSFPIYGSESHYVLRTDGFQSRDIFCNNLEQSFPHGWEEKTICTFSSESIMEDIGQCDGRLLSFLKNIQSGVSIILAMDYRRNGDENMWLKNRGYPGIYGNVLLLAETLSYEIDNYHIPIKDSLAIVENILASRGSTMIDCILHVTRLEEYHKSRVDGIDGFMNMSSSGFLTTYGNKDYKEVKSPDDSCPVVFKKRCSVCSNPVVTSCICNRAYYCSSHCKDIDWKSHTKYVHRGIFIR